MSDKCSFRKFNDDKPRDPIELLKEYNRKKKEREEIETFIYHHDDV